MMRRNQLVFRTLVALARQREGFDEQRVHAVLELVCAAEEVRNRVRRELHAFGLTELQFAVLVALFALDPVPGTPATLADHANVTRSAMTDALDRLHERGLVERVRSREDRRTWFVTLTPKGHAMTEEAVPVVLHHGADCARDLNASATQDLARLSGAVGATANSNAETSPSLFGHD